MDGLVSLLDQRHHDRIEVLFHLLQDRCGLVGMRSTPYPHFSWQLAESFNQSELPARMAEWAAAQQAFRIQTNGLGIFPGREPVLYLPVIRTRALNDLHAQLWQRFKELRSGEAAYYAPELWMPHITLAMGDLSVERLVCAVQLLARQSYEWTVEIDNLAVLFQPAGQRARLGYRFDFPTPEEE